MNIPPSRPRAKRPLLQRTWVRIVAVLLVALLGWKLFGGHGSSKTGGEQTVTVTVAPVTNQAVPVTINAVGNVVAYESVAIRARIDSQVVAVHFKDGDEVKQGDLLFELDDKDLRAREAELTANIASARANLENARRQSGRAQTLAEKGFATKATRDDASANAQVAQATLAASQAALESIKVQRGYTRITAPITGRTGTINVTLGNNVKANDTQPLVTINQLKPIRVQAALPQQYFTAVREAMVAGPLTVSARQQDGNTPIANGTLDYIDNSVDQATGTFVTRAGFENQDEQLLPGMFVTTTIALGAGEHALTVPEPAIQRGQAADYVFVITGDKAFKREVKVARMANGLAIITTGVAENETVATDGLLGLKDGSPVKIQPEKPAAVAAPAAPAPAPAPELVTPEAPIPASEEPAPAASEPPPIPPMPPIPPLPASEPTPVKTSE